MVRSTIADGGGAAEAAPPCIPNCEATDGPSTAATTSTAVAAPARIARRRRRMRVARAITSGNRSPWGAEE
ncbi:MYXO-CTERM sorting domain-containing protein [Catenulispora sp. MAP12-49]|uniref:MYXO-CTERM sorting domain-containing protein n=1 Tax=Catenulispora sp. MAP12-49 TaxID=3156302 RepID=UPI00351266D1